MDGILVEAHRRKEEEANRAESRRITIATGVPTDHEIRSACTKALAQAAAAPIEEATVSERVLQAASIPTRWRWRLAFAAAVAGVGLMTVGPLVGYLLGDLLVEEPPPPMLTSQVGEEAAGLPADPAAFEASMRERGLVRRAGRWIDAAMPEPPAARAEPYASVRRLELARRMAEDGFVHVEGGWVHPEALERLAAEREKAGRGEVREGGAWRSPRTVFRAAVPDPGVPVPMEMVRIASLEALFRVEPDRTRIAVQFETDLPPGARLVVTLARRERPASPFHSAIVRPDRSGKVALEIEPFDRPLEPGHYVVGLAYRPEFQPREIALADARTDVRAVEVAIGTAEEIARSLAARRLEL